MSVEKRDIERDLILARMIETQRWLAEQVQELNVVLGRLADRHNVPATLNAAEVAKMIGANPKTVKNWAAAGKIPCRRIEGTVFFIAQEVLEFADQRRRK